MFVVWIWLNILVSLSGSVRMLNIDKTKARIQYILERLLSIFLSLKNPLNDISIQPNHLHFIQKDIENLLHFLLKIRYYMLVVALSSINPEVLSKTRKWDSSDITDHFLFPTAYRSSFWLSILNLAREEQDINQWPAQTLWFPGRELLPGVRSLLVSMCWLVAEAFKWWR